MFVPVLGPNACLDLREGGRENGKKKWVRRKQRERESEEKRDAMILMYKKLTRRPR